MKYAVIVWFIVSLLLATAPGCSKDVHYVRGLDGENGANAVFSVAPAPSCEFGGYTLLAAADLNGNGVLDSEDGNIASLSVCNGLSAPPTAFTPVGLLDPCGDAPGRADEVLLLLSNGTVLASFSDNQNGLNTRFSVLENGYYRTTDGDNCYFTLTDGVISGESHNY